MPKFDVDVKLIGNDGNAFAILGFVKRGLRKAGATEEEVNEYFEESTQGDYNNLLSVAMKWVNVL